MSTWNEVVPVKWAAVEFGPHRNNSAIVLSLLLSLTALAIVSKNHLGTWLWADLAAFVAPIPIVLYFEDRIIRFRVFTYVVVIVLTLGAAILFGV